MPGSIKTGIFTYSFLDLSVEFHLPGVRMLDITPPGAGGVALRFNGIGGDVYLARGLTAVQAGQTVKNLMRTYSQLKGTVVTVNDKSENDHHLMIVHDVRETDTAQSLTSVPAGTFALLWTSWEFQSISNVAGYA